VIYCYNDPAEGLVSFCMQVRDEDGLETALAKADQVAGISFKTSFPFAVTAHLLKGLRAPATKVLCFFFRLTPPLSRC